MSQLKQYINGEWVPIIVGKQGAKGDTGDTGPQGSSAYEVAVQEGFVGTEEQWLASLVGPMGPAGSIDNVTLSALTDVEVTEPLSGQIIQYDNGLWINTSIINDSTSTTNSTWSSDKIDTILGDISAALAMIQGE